MKRFLAVCLLLCFVAAPAALAEAEHVAFELTGILEAVAALIAAVVLAVITYVAKKYVIPWLQKSDLMDAAVIVVNAVEALMGRGFGEEKWRLALEKMAERGYDINSERVLDAMRAAWKALDLQQILSGEKKPEEPSAEMTNE